MAITTYVELKTAVANWLQRSDLTARIPEFIELAEDRIGLDPRVRVRDMERSVNLVLKATTSVIASEVAGTANAITLTPATAATSYTIGDAYSLVAEANNTSAVTVNVSGLGAKAVVLTGNNTVLVANDIISGQPVDLYYDGTRFRLMDAPGAVPLPANFLGSRRMYLNVSNVPGLNYHPPEDFYRRDFADETAQPKAYTIEGDEIKFGPRPDSSYTARLLFWKKYAVFSADGDTNYLLTNARGLYLYGALLEAAPYLEDDARALTWSTLFDDTVEKLDLANKRDRHPGRIRQRSSVNGI